MVREQTKLKAVLKDKKITAYRLAKDCNIATANVYNLLNGKQWAYPKWRKTISEYLGIPENQIFELEEEEER